MRFTPRQFFLLAPLLFVAATQAAPLGRPAVNGVSATPQLAAAPLPAHDSRPADRRGGGRYGIGYEARQEMGAGEQRDRDGRIERPERHERIERPERVERGGRGR